MRSVRANPSLQRDLGSLSEESGKRTESGDVFNEGDLLRPKIANVKLLSHPSDKGETIATLGKGEELISWARSRRDS